MSSIIRNLSQQEQINFLLTNRIPRHALTRFIGWFSKIESPLLTRFSIALWKLFASDLDLAEARQQSFASLQQCFIRQLKPGARPINDDKDTIVSPCDAIVGACGRIEDTTVYQAKGYPYDLRELIPDRTLSEKFRDGIFVTLRLKSSMYHRFHAPRNGRVQRVDYISGDTWNVNPIALKRIEKLYCKNERAVLELLEGPAGSHLALVPVAAILVASMKFHCLPEALNLQYRGPNSLTCDANYLKGEEMGYFEHGSTIIVFASKGHQLCAGIADGVSIRMGEALLQQPAA